MRDDPVQEKGGILGPIRMRHARQSARDIPIADRRDDRIRVAVLRVAQDQARSDEQGPIGKGACVHRPAV
jgi:hypothetical protein